ncbi:uncharacterized protein LY89DRAFT_673788 [Mollisia scopiformis]|uniref:Uncharacterized protein n=1 Tax=Mollisia scopiformis TaxID=149040 RepID=A0A194WVJ7_MOLSC|nr:uncharacterized protein LY89DRAFT_673788 [Mollisia scopiformis]KUJ11993.1 hypothetical protein LY89DRAFT_673788 [Mollisia scopiformis]
MAPITLPAGRIQIHADPEPCKDFFQTLKYDIYHSQASGLDTFPTKDKLSWAVQQCPNSIEGLSDALSLAENKLTIHLESVLPNFERGQLIAFLSQNLSIPTPDFNSNTSTASIHTKPEIPAPIHKNAGIAFAVVALIVVVTLLVYHGVKYTRSIIHRREAERSARLRRAISPEDAKKAQEYLRGEWAEIDRRQAARAESIQLQELSTAVTENVAELAEVYRHPRMDWT